MRRSEFNLLIKIDNKRNHH